MLMPANDTARWLNTRERYGRLSIAMHWLMLMLLVASYLTMELHDSLSWNEDAVKSWHYAIGIGVFALVFLRLAIRMAGPNPRIHPAPAAWQRVLAMVMHLALYAFMIAMPVLGWLALGAEGEIARIPLLGWRIPLLAVGGEFGEDIVEAAEDLHEAVAVAGYWLIGLHTVAALFHHYVLRDDTLRRMLPLRARRSA